MIPPLAPLAAFFTLMGAAAILGAIFVGTYLRYKQQGEIAAAAKAKEANQHETSEQNTINHVYLKELKHKAYQNEEARLSRKVEAFSSSNHTMRALGGAEAFATAVTTPILEIGPPDSPVTTLARTSGIPHSPLAPFLKHPHDHKHAAPAAAPQPRAAGSSSRR